MHQFVKGDIAVMELDGETVHVEVQEVNGSKAFVYVLEGCEDNLETSLKKLTYVPPIHLTRKQLQSFIRGEVFWSELVDDDYARVEASEKYTFNLEDLEVLVSHLLKMDKEARTMWLWEYTEQRLSEDDLYKDPFDCNTEDGLPTPEEQASEAMSAIAWACHTESTDDLQEISNIIHLFKKERNEPILKRHYTDHQKVDFVTYWDRTGGIELQSDDMQQLFDEFLHDLVQQKEPEGLEIMARSCYGEGRNGYETNWDTARDCLLELMKVMPAPQYAYMLGCIYDDGFCSHGRPQYAHAFKYFSIAAAGGIVNAVCRLSDLYRLGHGVTQNLYTAQNLLDNIYDHFFAYVCTETLDNPFGMIAVRMAQMKISSDGDFDGMDEDADHAYRYLLQAEYALNERAFSVDEDSSQNYRDHITKLLDEAVGYTAYLTKTNTIYYPSVEDLLYENLNYHHIFAMKIKEDKDHNKVITISLIQNEMEDEKWKIFLTLEDAHCCILTDSITLHTENLEEYHIDCDDVVVRFDSICGNSFYLYGQEVAVIDADYVYHVPAKKKGK